MQTSDTKEHASFVTTTKGMRGYFAVQVWWNPDLGGFWEPWQSGIGSYATQREAEVDARAWAESEGLEFKESV